MLGPDPPRSDVIVVGSGPSGISVAEPLLEAGLRVTLLDGGGQREDEGLPGAYHDARRTEDSQWRTFLGPRLEALRPAGPPSPKFRTPAGRSMIEGFSKSTPVLADGFVHAGSLASGGFSTLWGAGLSVYDDLDLADFPLSVDDLEPSYHRIAERMGVSGFEDDDLATGLDARITSQPPTALCGNARVLLERYATRRPQESTFALGRSRVAVLTEARGDREACGLCDACLWGCRHGSVWHAGFELDRLRQQPGLDYRPGTIVLRIERDRHGYRLVSQEQGRSGAPEAVTLRTRRLVLAAGTLASTRLVLDLGARFGEPLPLTCSPTAGFALCMPERLGAALSTRDFSMAQLSFTTHIDAERCGGNLFPASGLPSAAFIQRMPLSRPAAVALSRRIQSSLLLGNVFLPGAHDSHRIHLAPSPDGASVLVLQAATGQRTRELMRETRNRLRRAFLGLGALMLPGSFTVSLPGSDLRHAGTLPMRREPGPFEVDPAGELHGHPGLHVVDLSIFPNMGAKHPTFTLMANADRIGRIVARRAAREAVP